MFHFIFFYRIPTRRVVVSAFSEYFETMFTTSMQEKDKKEVEIGNDSGPILRNLIEYCYTGHFAIDAENVIESLEAATMFRLVNLAAKCADYLKNHVNLGSCLIAWTTAKLYDLNDLASISCDFICYNFSAIVETDAFRNLSVTQLFDILINPELAADSEDDILESIFKWIEADAENRRKEFENLLPAIRMSKISYAVNGSLQLNSFYSIFIICGYFFSYDISL